MSNYDKMTEQARTLFMGLDQEAMIRNLRLRADARDLYLRFLMREYRIGRKDGRIRETADGKAAGFNEALSIYDALSHGDKPLPAADPRMVPIESLNRVMQGGKRLGDGFYDRQAAVFEEKGDALRTACLTLGGKEAGKGDVSFDFPAFPWLPMRFSFYFSDEDFPASIRFFFPQNAEAFLRYETLWYVAAHLTERISTVL